MATRRRYEELLENIRKAHDAHQKAFRAAGSWHGKDREAVVSARKTLDEFNRQLRLLYSGQLEPLRARFLERDANAISEVITFLEADVPAFQSGYNKEWYYGKLKQMILRDEHIERLRQIALARCASNEYRREDSELRRLMIKLADMDFLNAVAEIPVRKGSRADGHKMRMIEVVFRGRKDLRDEFNSGRKPLGKNNDHDS
jgi:hypothetical protein